MGGLCAGNTEDASTEAVPKNIVAIPNSPPIV